MRERLQQLVARIREWQGLLDEAQNTNRNPAGALPQPRGKDITPHSAAEWRKHEAPARSSSPLNPHGDDSAGRQRYGGGGGGGGGGGRTSERGPGGETRESRFANLASRRSSSPLSQRQQEGRTDSSIENAIAPRDQHQPPPRGIQSKQTLFAFSYLRSYGCNADLSVEVLSSSVVKLKWESPVAESGPPADVIRTPAVKEDVPAPLDDASLFPTAVDRPGLHRRSVTLSSDQLRKPKPKQKRSRTAGIVHRDLRDYQSFGHKPAKMSAEKSKVEVPEEDWVEIYGFHAGTPRIFEGEGSVDRRVAPWGEMFTHRSLFCLACFPRVLLLNSEPMAIALPGRSHIIIAGLKAGAHYQFRVSNYFLTRKLSHLITVHP